jgi:hypothetical protein
MDRTGPWRHIAKSGTIGAIIGIYKMGDLQMIYSPNAFVLGNAAIINKTALTCIQSQPSTIRMQAILVQL